jgi:hypothetical protein
VAKAKKAKKDGVKRPLSSYMLFAKAVRGKVVAENPSACPSFCLVPSALPL